ncbi:hypothetical protein ZWY2020_059403 [Hordeum vulgare]|nr:hypothetical protein ZWY2020_059403 [Hordeum vulgare]
MSWSNCESSAPGFRGASGRRRGTEARSPVPYRQNPMAYEPEVLCHCNPRRKAPRWISWSRANPGRRYCSCVNAMNGDGCGFVQWYDSQLPKFVSDLIGDLRDEVWRLCGQDNVPHVSVEQGEECTDQFVSVEPTVKDLQDQLKEKSAEIAALKGNFEKVVFIVLVFVFGVVAGKMFAF